MSPLSLPTADPGNRPRDDNPFRAFHDNKQWAAACLHRSVTTGLDEHLKSQIHDVRKKENFKVLNMLLNTL